MFIYFFFSIQCSNLMNVKDGNDDFSRGQLKIINNRKYLEFCDDYEHVDNTIEYITENVLMELPVLQSDNDYTAYSKLLSLYNSCFTNFCKCKYIEDRNCCGKSTNLDAVCCSHGGNYTISDIDPNQPKSSKELVLSKVRPANDLIYECMTLCACYSPAPLCHNRLVQFGPRKNLKIICSLRLSEALGTNQMTLITETKIPAGAFICEYVGEILTKEEVHRRHKYNYHNSMMNYIICLNEDVKNDAMDDLTDSATFAIEKQPSIQTFIDPTFKGNIGRYLNHSCSANCEIFSVRVDGPIPKLGMFVF